MKKYDTDWEYLLMIEIMNICFGMYAQLIVNIL